MNRDLLLSPRLHSAIAALLIIFFLLILTVFWQREISLLLVVFLCGAAGGFISTYVRLRRLPTEDLSGAQPVVRSLAILQVYVTPVIGGAFGLVLYGAALTGLIGGHFFPEFQKTNEPYTGVLALFRGVSPKTQLDAAKALFWAFLAGFSERLVPNILDRLVDESSDRTRGS